ncbi:MAG: membrane dipeptidase, partial [Clostridia bacterium]|nr:membrane dipeptidase [Clostridia bacterium]
MSFPVFDLHCDTANVLIGKDQLKCNAAHIDLDRASTLCGYAQCFACFTTFDLADDISALFNDKMNAILDGVQKNSNVIRQAFSAAEIEQNYKEGLMSAILTIEGPCGFGFAPEKLEELRQKGFLFTTLGWNEQNVLTGSCVTGGGLTDLGREYVREAQRLGMIIDVSHISDEGFWDIINITNGPVVATHS